MTPGRAPHRATGAALVAILVVACGGPTGSVDPGDSVVLESPFASATASGSAGTSASPSAGSIEPSGSASPTPSTEPSATPKPTPKSTPTPTAGQGSLSPGLCALLSVAYMESMLNVGGIAARAEPGDASAGSCTYLVGDRGVAATTLLAKGAAQVIATYAGTGQKVSDVGDEAIWIPSSRTLFARVGDRLFGVQFPAAGPVGPEDAKAIAIALGKTAVARL